MVYTSWPCDYRQQAVGKHCLKICICELVLSKVQNVDIEIRYYLNFAVFVLFV